MSTQNSTLSRKWMSTKFLGIAGFSLLTIAALLTQTSTTQRTVPLNLAINSTQWSPSEQADQPVYEPPRYAYTIQKGDTLSQIFSRLNIPLRSIQELQEADLNHLKIDTLQPGNTMRFWVDSAAGRLNRLELEFSIAQKVAYQRVEDNGFELEEINIPGDWEDTIASGEIHGSFSVSAQKAGLNATEIYEITNLLKEKLNFSRDLRAGDNFEVVISRQSVNDTITGQHEIRAIRIHSRGRSTTAYLHSDGNFYDSKGESLQRAFLRYPYERNRTYRISSSFNPKRRHPVTGRISPHNGVDFATPTGTPVIATGDGVVSQVVNHPYAGRYVVIQHGTNYRTRYLHNSKVLVRKGQKVSRGQRIALAGATGRVTGPHIHYEFLIRNRAVNPMTANIPMASSVPSKEKGQFKETVALYDEMMDNPNRSLLSMADTKQEPEA
ncbi:peptidoglycan DD-metalloendopeptidase family protein [Photobacterium lutimaris]|uniref:Peptidase M23 n=1 Tax=Photobacterium lutimaris TaxID=388278 RepID=A0A2T3IQ84_9GAMM|nr:peptidoglycan DD-metalloendopeptidase family protein [Photobacterium lutimaris]PSU30494.1 peptidase M23 [Photobacterium lutimaris]TDR76055.1 murein DD-endopeptidase MepM/ murein hydrolase activator NlpD [Photobacterium lutimaris]